MRYLRNSLIALAALAAAFRLSLAPGDPALYPAPLDAPTYQIHVVDHGWHAGLIVRPRDLAIIGLAMPDEEAAEASTLLSLSRLMGAGEWVEIGWGGAEFYQAEVSSPFDAPVIAGLDAVTGTEDTIVHVFPGLGPPEDAFPASETVALTLGQAGFRRLALALARSFDAPAGLPVDLGPGLYGYARFYRGRGRYSGLNTCNNWVASLLREAGAPSSMTASTFSFGLMAELRWRVL